MAAQMARTRSLGGEGTHQIYNTPREKRKYTLNITIRGSHRDRSNTKNIINDLSGPTKFSDNLFICQGGERIMAPSVNADLMTTKIFFLKKSREGNDSGSHNKHSRKEVGLAEIREEIRTVSCRTIIICKAPLVLIGTSGDIRFASATTTRPPATARVYCRSRVRRASTNNIRSEAWDCNTGINDLLDPRLDFRRIRRRRPVKWWIIGRRQRGD